MIILEDSRQQRLKHNVKRDYFRSKGIVLRKETLDCGDYTLINDRSVVIDTKKDIQELIGDINAKTCTKEYLEEKVKEIYEKYQITGFSQVSMVNTIYGDEIGRYTERDILHICNEFNIVPEAEKEFQKLYIKRRGFFHRGLKRAEFGDVKLYVLVENEDGIKSVDDVKNWVNPRAYMKKWITTPDGKKKKIFSFPNATKGETLYKSICTMQERYGVTFLFCSPEEAGAKILELLGVN